MTKERLFNRWLYSGEIYCEFYFSRMPYLYLLCFFDLNNLVTAQIKTMKMIDLDLWSKFNAFYWPTHWNNWQEKKVRSLIKISSSVVLPFRAHTNFSRKGMFFWSPSKDKLSCHLSTNQLKSGICFFQISETQKKTE